jgi:hypothetical protein
MRGTTIVGLLMALAASACDEDAKGRIDAVRRNGRRYMHGEDLLPFERSGSAVRSLSPKLREDPNGRALLDLGEAMAPELAKLLDDPERRTLAAVFLAEGGKERGATELLRRWQVLRGQVKEEQLYRLRRGTAIGIGYRYQGVDGQFYAEVVLGLTYAAQPVSAKIAADTRAAIEESARLEASGQQLLFREEREEDGARIEVRWSAEPVETASEGLRILAMAAAPEAPSLLEGALRSRIPALRRTALREAAWLGRDGQKLLPAIRPLLDDPDLGDEAIEQVARIVEGITPSRPFTTEQRAALVARLR